MKAGRGGAGFDDEDEEDSGFFLFLGTGGQVQMMEAVGTEAKESE